MTIEEMENQNVMFDSLQYAEQAGATINKEIGDYEELLVKLDD